MFTGIIETTAVVKEIISAGSNKDIWLTSSITDELKIDQSVAHNGVCLTVVAIEANSYKVTAVNETLQKTNLSSWKTGDIINLERSLKVGDRLDGHFVQGHIDTVGKCIHRQALNGSWIFRFAYDIQFALLVIEKGSICINGVSLTVFNVTESEFSVTIIPYTFEHTCFKIIDAGSIVNIEFDVLGKYLLRSFSVNKAQTTIL